MLAAKFFNSSNNEDQEAPWLQNPWRKDAVAFIENMMNWSNFCLWSQYAWIILLQHIASPVTTLKKNSYICLGL